MHCGDVVVPGWDDELRMHSPDDAVDAVAVVPPAGVVVVGAVAVRNRNWQQQGCRRL